MDSNINYEDVKSGLMPRCNRVFKTRGGTSWAEMALKALISLWWQMKIGHLRLLHTPAGASALEVLMSDLLMIQLLNSFNFQCGIR